MVAGEGKEWKGAPYRVPPRRGEMRLARSAALSGGVASPASSMTIAWFAVSKRCTAGTVTVTLVSGGDGK